MSDEFFKLHKDKIEFAMLDTLGDAICKTTGINREEHRKATDKQVDKIKELECNQFHFGFFSDLIEGDTKAEAKALMNNIIPDFYKMPHPVSNTQLRLTSYIYYRALFSLTQKRIHNYLANSKNSAVTVEDVNKANEIAEQIEKYLVSQIDVLAQQQRQKEDEKLK